MLEVAGLSSLMEMRLRCSLFPESSWQKGSSHNPQQEHRHTHHTHSLLHDQPVTHAHSQHAQLAAQTTQRENTALPAPMQTCSIHTNNEQHRWLDPFPPQEKNLGKSVGRMAETQWSSWLGKSKMPLLRPDSPDHLLQQNSMFCQHEWSTCLLGLQQIIQHHFPQPFPGQTVKAQLG